MIVQIWRNHDATEWTTVCVRKGTDPTLEQVDVFGNPMVMAHAFETDDPFYDGLEGALMENRVAKKASTAYQIGYTDALGDTRADSLPRYTVQEFSDLLDLANDDYDYDLSNDEIMAKIKDLLNEQDV